MQVERLHGMARELMDKHGLTDWSFTVDFAKRRFGRCQYRSKTISLSLPLVKLNSEDEVRDTMLHEIAHAIAGHSAGHGSQWRRTAHAVGARAERCFGDQVVTPPKAFKGICPSCSREVLRHRRTRIACSKCCRGRFNPAFVFVWSRNR